MGEFKKLLEPGYIKNSKIKNRTSMGPMEKQWGDRLGTLNQRVLGSSPSAPTKLNSFI